MIPLVRDFILERETSTVGNIVDFCHSRYLSDVPKIRFLMEKKPHPLNISMIDIYFINTSVIVLKHRIYGVCVVSVLINGNNK